MARRVKGAIPVKGLVKGVDMSMKAQYTTTDGRSFANANLANQHQAAVNRTDAIRKVLKESGLLNSAGGIPSKTFAIQLSSTDLLGKLTQAAKTRVPRLTPEVVDSKLAAKRAYNQKAAAKKTAAK